MDTLSVAAEELILLDFDPEGEARRLRNFFGDDMEAWRFCTDPLVLAWWVADSGADVVEAALYCVSVCPPPRSELVASPWFALRKAVHERRDRENLLAAMSSLHKIEFELQKEALALDGRRLFATRSAAYACSAVRSAVMSFFGETLRLRYAGLAASAMYAAASINPNQGQVDIGRCAASLIKDWRPGPPPYLEVPAVPLVRE